MPVYTILSKKKIESARKRATVEAITNTHCGMTGAPTEFVNVVFMTGYGLKDGYEAVLLGNVRKGGNRTDSTLQELQNGIHQAVIEALQLPRTKVNIEFSGFEPTWGWEGGAVLPMPGDEGVWLSRKNKKHV